ncbi:hypothetical protein CONLIGDRAFT_510990 [Coniochaeta ligniaria NRRL 30616]|uniref:Uncharacterized protein n=1 Tax=Coniochaeta ligniaria NRRL 30616 TaxID=1408157 RepID=A0A1J7IF44_9PEZI|nr:hypothetical protein CONLIGDRAFT_510990 [Coniochaeta ligniaria NRRL 30616]
MLSIYSCLLLGHDTEGGIPFLQGSGQPDRIGIELARLSKMGNAWTFTSIAMLNRVPVCCNHPNKHDTYLFSADHFSMAAPASGESSVELMAKLCSSVAFSVPCLRMDGGFLKKGLDMGLSCSTWTKP